MAITILCQIVLWVWFLGCTVTYRLGKKLLVEGVGLKSAEFAVLCLYSFGIIAFHCFPPTGKWILLDFGDIIVHVFDSENRLFYDLERIWRDGKVIEASEL